MLLPLENAPLAAATSPVYDAEFAASETAEQRIAGGRFRDRKFHPKLTIPR